jgi:hypothetical protein
MRSRVIKLSFFAVIFGCLFLNGSAQVPSNNKGKAVKWTAVNGKNNEFAVFMPEGYVTGGRSNYRLAQPGDEAQVDRQLILARYINGIILLTEYYEGSARRIQKILQDREKLPLEKEEEINGFQVKSFSGKSEKRFQKTQQFLFKDRLYIVKGISPSENDPLVKAFFESVRLTNQDKTVAPNAAAGVAVTSLPQLVEREPERVADSKTFAPSEVERPPLILRMMPPRDNSRTESGFGSGRVRLKVLLSSSGEITSVEVVESASRLMAEASIQAVKQTIFIPAEKDGKLVSVYKIIEHSFGSR